MTYRKFLCVAAILIMTITVGSMQSSAQEGRGRAAIDMLANVLSDGFSLYYLEDDLGTSINSYLQENDPPLLRNLVISPTAPAPGDTISITAEISNNPEQTQSETLDVELRYSLDDKASWETIDMDNDSDDSKTWTASIPALEEPGTLYFYFFAEDDAGNYYMEVPSSDIAWASEEEDGYLVSINDKNSISRVVEDDIDMLDLSVGYDGEMLYFKTVVEGEISGGTVTPFNVNVYSVGFFFNDSPGGLGPKPDYVLTHSQHAQFIHFPIIGLLDVNERLSEIHAAEPRYYSKRNSLCMRIKKSVFDKHNYKYIRTAFGTAIGTSPLDLVIETKDISSFINLVPGGHSIIVE